MMSIITILLFAAGLVLANIYLAPWIFEPGLNRAGIAVLSLALWLLHISDVLHGVAASLKQMWIVVILFILLAVVAVVALVGIVMEGIWLVGRFRAWGAAGLSLAFWLKDTNCESVADR